MSCSHVRQDLQCSCSVGDERPNAEHHERCMRRGHPCSPGRCPDPNDGLAPIDERRMYDQRPESELYDPRPDPETGRRGGWGGW